MGEALPSVRKTKRRKSVSKRLKIIMAVCFGLAAVLVFGGLYLNQQEIIRANAEEAATYTPPKAAETSKPDAALFVGDSYTDGARAATPDTSWAHLAGRQLGWVPLISADSGSGYITAGQDGETTLTLIEGAAGTNPQHVVIASSFNDSLSDPEAFTSAVEEAFTTASEQWPDAEITVFGPWNPRFDMNDNQVRARAILQEEAAASGFTFADPADWLEPGLIDADGIHPTPEGHQVLGEKAAQALEG